MPSPFPGMNPYVEHEENWPGFHHIFITECLGALAPQAAPKYLVKIEINVYIHERSAEERMLGKPDVVIAGRKIRRKPARGARNGDAPVYAVIPQATDTVRLASLEIREIETKELITAIEVLSPSNKRPGSVRDQYMAKRMHYFCSNANFVEIDLLRGYPRLPMQGMPECDYCAMVSRAEERPQVGVWPIGLRHRLPSIPIPLRAPDKDLKLNLQDILNGAYDTGAFANYIYNVHPQPPLRAEDTTWARKIIEK